MTTPLPRDDKCPKCKGQLYVVLTQVRTWYCPFDNKKFYWDGDQWKGVTLFGPTEALDADC